MWLPYLVLFLPFVVNAIFDFELTDVIDVLGKGLECLFDDAYDFHCGTSKFQHQVTKCGMKNACPLTYEKMNNCCRKHDRCYECSKGRGRRYCDQEFSSCLHRHAHRNRCHAVALTLSIIVNKYGEPYYHGNQCHKRIVL